MHKPWTLKDSYISVGICLLRGILFWVELQLLNKESTQVLQRTLSNKEREEYYCIYYKKLINR